MEDPRQVMTCCCLLYKEGWLVWNLFPLYSPRNKSVSCGCWLDILRKDILLFLVFPVLVEGLCLNCADRTCFLAFYFIAIVIQLQLQQFYDTHHLIMQKERQTLKLIIAGRYSRMSLHENQQQQYTDRSAKQIHIFHKEKSKEQLKQQEEEEQRRQQEENQAKKMIKDKYKTFMRWDFRKSLPVSFKIGGNAKKKVEGQVRQPLTVNLSFMIKANEEESKKNNRNIKFKKSKQKQKTSPAGQNKPKANTDNATLFPDIGTPAQKTIEPQLTAQMQAIKNQRRQRFKKLQNPIHFLKHYLQKQHFRPTTQQKHLIQKLISIQKIIDIQITQGTNNADHQDKFEEVLESIYELMNLSVDYNQLLFLALIVSLAADLCYFLKDYPRAFYFYNQVRIAGSYARKDKLKYHAMMGMGRICFDLQYLDEAKRLFRKALQYAWRNNDEDTELEVYDCFGQIHNQKGKIKLSLYYHEKFAKNALEPASSALKKISKQMLRDYDTHIQSLEDSNLDSLFLQYIHLPLNKSFEVKSKANPSKKYKNYNELGNSPRFNKQTFDFSRQSFPDIKFQLDHLFQQDYEFKNEIPDPDKPGSRQLNRLLHKDHESTGDGNKKRQIHFQHSIQFNRIMKKKHEKPDVSKQLKKSLQEQVQEKLKQRLDPKWYEQMVFEIKKRRVEKMGSLKERVRNSHLSYSKYPSERKRQAIWSTEKINQSFNKTLLDWIDPVQ